MNRFLVVLGRLGGSFGGLGGSWAALGRLLGGLGRLLGHLGRLFGNLGVVLDRSWTILAVMVDFSVSKLLRAASFGGPRGAKMKSKWGQDEAKSDPRRTKIEDKNGDEKRRS